MREKARLLYDISHLPAQLHRILLLYILSEQKDRSPVRLIKAVGHLEKGCLAASGGSQDCDQLSVPDFGTQVVDRKKAGLFF